MDGWIQRKTAYVPNILLGFLYNRFWLFWLLLDGNLFVVFGSSSRALITRVVQGGKEIIGLEATSTINKKV
jgi:hypothetical protein